MDIIWKVLFLTLSKYATFIGKLIIPTERTHHTYRNSKIIIWNKYYAGNYYAEKVVVCQWADRLPISWLILTKWNSNTKLTEIRRCPDIDMKRESSNKMFFSACHHRYARQIFLICLCVFVKSTMSIFIFEKVKRKLEMKTYTGKLESVCLHIPWYAGFVNKQNLICRSNFCLQNP